MAANATELAVELSFSAKDEIRALLDRPPDSVTLADIQYHLPLCESHGPRAARPERRKAIAYEYRLMYRVEATCVRILRVVHGRRLLANVPGGFEEAPQAAYKAA